jgi:ferredoxin-type protein NapH
VSLAGRYTLARRCVQAAFALFFLAAPALALTSLGGTAIALRIGPVDLLEPTSVLSALLAAGTLSAAAIVGALPLAAASATFGSVFCGWMCPYGLISEGLDRALRGPNSRWRGRPWATARAPRFAALAAILFASLALGAPWVAVFAPPRLVSALPVEARALGAVPVVTAALLAAVIALDLVRRRLVCRVLCPVGAGAALMRSPFTWRPRFDRARCRCAGTPACLTACSWGLDPREMAWCDGCTACLACVEQCPSGALQIRRRTITPQSLEER